MTTLYKLTTQFGNTQNNTKWFAGATHVSGNYDDLADAEGNLLPDASPQLCTRDVIHAYDHPLVAVVLNQMHAAFQRPLLWLAEGEVVAADPFNMKVGCLKLTTIREIPLPKVPTEARVRFAVQLALDHGALWREKNPEWEAWATAWLNGTDRSAESASKAGSAVYGRSALWTDYAAYYACRAALNLALDLPRDAIYQVASVVETISLDKPNADINLGELIQSAIDTEAAYRASASLAAA